MANIKMDDVFSMSSFDPSKFTESFRDFAEKGAQQSREAYAKMKSAGEEASKTLEVTVQTAQAGAVEIGHHQTSAYIAGRSGGSVRPWLGSPGLRRNAGERARR